LIFRSLAGRLPAFHWARAVGTAVCQAHCVSQLFDGCRNRQLRTGCFNGLRRQSFSAYFMRIASYTNWAPIQNTSLLLSYSAMYDIDGVRKSIDYETSVRVI
jgi:hypothetical protein